MFEGKKFFAIEDDIDIQKILKNFFTKRGAEFECSSGIFGSIDKLKHFKADLILLDLKLQFESGLDLSDYIDEIPSIETTKIIVISKYSKPSNIKKCLQKGVVDFITKPFMDLDELEVRISKHL